MSTIRPAHRTDAGWQLPARTSCGFPLRHSNRFRHHCRHLLAGVLALTAGITAHAQDLSDFDGPSAGSAIERASDTTRQAPFGQSATVQAPIGQPMYGQAANGDPSSESVRIFLPRTSIDLTQNSSKIFEFRQRLLSVDGHDGQLIDVQPLGSNDLNKLRVRGLLQGVTTMIVTDESGQKFTVDIYVGGDARELQAVLKRAFKDSSIHCQALKNDTVLLTGFVTDDQTIAQVMEVARTYAGNVINHMRVGGPQEVQLRVKIIEVQRSKLRTFGINFLSLTKSSVIASTPGPITPLSAFTNGIGATPTLTVNPTGGNSPSFTAGISGNHFAFEYFLQALKEEGLLKVYTEPVLVTRSGEASEISDGGEFPIPVPGGLGTVTIEFREFGVILKSLPLVVSPTRVKLQVSAEVSEKDVASAVTLNGTSVPGITKRKVQSVIDMNFGNTMVMGGLILTRDVATTYKTPFLGEIPVIGAAFSKKVYQRSETETVILITPEFGSSIPSGQIPPGGPGQNTVEPTDRELYLGGLIEVPKYGADCGPDCRTEWPTRYQGNSNFDAGARVGPAINPSPTIPTGLIGPRGDRSGNSVPPAPSQDGVSRRSRNGTNPSAGSREVVSTKSRMEKPANDPDAVRPAGFKRSQNADRAKEKKRSATIDDDTWDSGEFIRPKAEKRFDK